jgi:ATP-dependent RNA helicase DHX29
VRIHYLEDVIEATGYACELDSQYTRRDVRQAHRDAARSTTIHVTGAGGHSHATTVEWDDAAVKGGSGIAHEGAHLDVALYSASTRRTVGRLDLRRANNDLLVELLLALLPPTSVVGGDIDYGYAHAQLVRPPETADDGDVDDAEPAGAAAAEDDAQAVLIFMAGLAQIQQLHDVLRAHRHFGNAALFRIVALHSALVGSDNAGAAFEVPPRGCRKIVISTNIAETGITIPDVAFVIDTGRVKQTGFDERGECSFMYRYILRESCSQFDSLPLTSLTISPRRSS